MHALTPDPTNGPEQDIRRIFEDLIGRASYSNLDSLLSEESVSDVESKILAAGTVPPVTIHFALDSLRNDFELDYDDLVFAGGWVPRLPQMIVRNYFLRHFLVLGNGLAEPGMHFHDATLNNAADDYTGFIDLLVVKIQTLCESRHYSLEPEDEPVVAEYLTAIIVLMHYCHDMLDMSSTLRPSLFQRRANRMRGRVKSALEMSTFRQDYPEIQRLLDEMCQAVDDLLRDEKMRDLQLARNERYKQSKIRLYKYTIRVTEELNDQLEACDPYDITHRNDLRKQLEQVQIFMRSFDKDR